MTGPRTGARRRWIGIRLAVLGALLVVGGLLSSALADPNVPTHGPESRTADRPEWLEVTIVIALVLLSSGGLPIAYLGITLLAVGGGLLLWDALGARRS